MQDKIKKAADMIRKARRIVVFTGAGVSTESGIPDFRSPGGLWTRFDPDDFTIDKFLSSSETRQKMWKILLEGGLIQDAEPNAAHLAVAQLEKIGKISSVITQNIDNLHQKAGNDPARVYELHGNMKWLVCTYCARRYPLDKMKQRFTQSAEIPECEKCHGILKPDVIFFGESLPTKTLMQATVEAQECDLLIVIGSSLVVYPAAYMPLYAKRSGAGIIIINLGPTEQDSIADVLINAKAGETMKKIMEQLKKGFSGDK